jgi:hypothetical protein
MNSAASQPMVQPPVHPTSQPQGNQVQGQWYDHAAYQAPTPVAGPPQVPQPYYQHRLPLNYQNGMAASPLDEWYMKPEDQGIMLPSARAAQLNY